MKNFFQNTWVVAIIGGIISGIIVYIITNFVKDRKQKIDYERSINMANIDVLNAIRPYIANSAVPDSKQLQAIINSVSRRYNIKSDDMENVQMFYEDLVYEFVSNPYISDEAKKKNVEVFMKYIEDLRDVEKESEVAEKNIVPSIPRIFDSISTILGIISAIITMGSTLIVTSFDNNAILVVLIACVTTIIFMTSVIYILVKRKRYKKSLMSKINYWDVERLKVTNHGPDIFKVYSNEKMNFIDYF